MVNLNGVKSVANLSRVVYITMVRAQQTDSIIAALRSVRVVPYIKPLRCPILRVCLYTIYTKP